MFVKSKFSMHIVVLLYVDDMIITGDDDVGISHICDALSVPLI